MLILNGIIFIFTANYYALAVRFGEYRVMAGAVLAVLFLLGNGKPSLRDRKIPDRRLRICQQGSDLLVLFCISTGVSVLYLLLEIQQLFTGEVKVWLLHLLNVFLVEAVVFWNGIIRVYLTSKQLALKWRLLGLICGFMPVVNLVVLYYIIRITGYEAKLEGEKLLVNEKRKGRRVCATKYPILLVHGVFFRDFKYLNYWGRIPGELEKNGAVIYYGNHQSADSVEGSARELSERIRQITEETGCGKLNIIAHSKGGLDCRYALSELGIADRVASLTTINTPHKGCLFADYLLEKIPEEIQRRAADTYNRAVKVLGDENPDFMEAVRDLTKNACTARNQHIKDAAGVYYQSAGSKCNGAFNGRFPLNATYPLVKHFDGENDGLVSTESFPWGENFYLVTVKGKRGVTHGDMIDLNRENIPGFDVREFYVNLVADLKKKGF
ncbi:MAG: alpha/beta hydrolase [Lachnospiraceae bacterium]|jgi:triacylglycerol lipase|nr:alpha/beta hydrolase [Lachnospiraceae bacterium]